MMVKVCIGICFRELLFLFTSHFTRKSKWNASFFEGDAKGKFWVSYFSDEL